MLAAVWCVTCTLPCRSCRRIEEQQQLHLQQHRKAGEELLQAMKQQYIEFMTNGQQLDSVSAQDPTSHSQTHTHHASGQPQVLLPWTDSDAHKQLQQHPGKTQQEETPCFSRPQLPREEDMTPAVQTPSILSHGHRGSTDRYFPHR